MTEVLEPVPTSGEDIEPHVIDRQSYVRFGEEQGFHPHDVIMSWYFLANDFVYSMRPGDRIQYEDEMRRRNGAHIAVRFFRHPPPDRRWIDGDMGDIDGLDVDSLEEYLTVAAQESRRAGLEITDWLGRRCKPQMVELWQKLVRTEKVPEAALE